ncbi:nickel/cobalt transporter [Pseudooceanicola onchidii]|uniref:nickel/cobalt transporter n=1 Tax=Pseudooceanicola onchidii TaxID=2562279 RepID=UPI0010AA16DD|nr:hypothetical protein [Pseudooceanicola onchidii]
MRARGLIWTLPLVVAAGVALWLWMSGGLDSLAVWAAEGQREAQNAIARGVRAIKQGDPGALAGLMGVAFLYGLFHAAGPGHGKLLIGGYGLGRAVPALRLSALALASSLAQSAMAVLMVGAGLGLLAWTRTQVTGLADGALSLVSYLAVAGVGLWLVLRGVRGLRRPGAACGHAAHHDHDTPHHHHHDETCPTCGHAHGPTPAQAEQVHSLRDALVLVGAVAIRPCTGALFLLIITWRMGIFPAGIAGTFAMGLGTGLVTVIAALASVWLRRASVDRLRAALPDPATAARIAAATELAAGALVAFAALSLAIRLL